MRKEKLEKQELISFNSELSEFDLKQLEERLETDPLAVGGLLDLESKSEDILLSSDTCETNCSGLFVCNSRGK